MTIYLGLILAFLVALTAFAVAAFKSAWYWRNRQRDLAVTAVERYASDLDTDNSLVRSELCARMLSYLRSDVEYCLVRCISPRTLVLAGFFFALYASYRFRIFLRVPPRRIDALCNTVRRLSEAVR